MAEQSESDGWIQIAADYEARLTKVEIDRNMLVKALEDLLGSSQAVHQWLTNWDVPFADDDEWAGDKKLFAEARNEAARVLGAVGGRQDGR